MAGKNNKAGRGSGGSVSRQKRIQAIRTGAMVAASNAESRAGLTRRIGDGKTAQQRMSDNRKRKQLPEMQRNARISRIGRGDTNSDYMMRGNGNRAQRRAQSIGQSFQVIGRSTINPRR
jgi:hypothetical protein